MSYYSTIQVHENTGAKHENFGGGNSSFLKPQSREIKRLFNCYPHNKSIYHAISYCVLMHMENSANDTLANQIFLLLAVALYD